MLRFVLHVLLWVVSLNLLAMTLKDLFILIAKPSSLDMKCHIPSQTSSRLTQIKVARLSSLILCLVVFGAISYDLAVDGIEDNRSQNFCLLSLALIGQVITLCRSLRVSENPAFHRLDKRSTISV